MQNIRLTLQYSPPKDGFEKTVSYKITSALRGITGEDIVLHAGAKTEPGIHAMAQTVSFQTGSDLAPEQFRRNLNQYLPQDIAVLDAASAGPVPRRLKRPKPHLRIPDLHCTCV